MKVNTQTPGRMKIIAGIILLITIYVSISVLIVFGATYLSDGLIAIVFLTVAVILPIREKRFSFYSVFLIVSGVSFLVSGVIDNAYDTVVHPLPVLKQIEFSKIMRPEQISRGLTDLGSGLIFILLGLARFQTNKLSERSESNLPKVLMFILAVVGVLRSMSGITSIIEGLSKLNV